MSLRDIAIMGCNHKCKDCLSFVKENCNRKMQQIKSHFIGLLPEKYDTGKNDDGSCKTCYIFGGECECVGFNEAIDQMKKNMEEA